MNGPGCAQKSSEFLRASCRNKMWSARRPPSSRATPERARARSPPSAALLMHSISGRLFRRPLHRPARESTIRRAAPRRLLNCFAYTCSFSVVGRTVGAKTVSIDLSRKSLDRGRDNFVLNRLATNDHRFLADDVLDVLPRLARKGEHFDAIILDPPTFSRSHRGKAWQVERDFEGLLLAALDVAERDAKILLSTNCTTLDERALEVMGRFCLKATRRAGNCPRARCPIFRRRRGDHRLAGFAVIRIWTRCVWHIFGCAKASTCEDS